MDYWKFVDREEKTTSVESHSYTHKVPDAIQITKEEYDEFIASLPEPIPPPKPIDLATEFEALKGRVAALEKR